MMGLMGEGIGSDALCLSSEVGGDLIAGFFIFASGVSRLSS